MASRKETNKRWVRTQELEPEANERTTLPSLQLTAGQFKTDKASYHPLLMRKSLSCPMVTIGSTLTNLFSSSMNKMSGMSMRIWKRNGVHQINPYTVVKTLLGDVSEINVAAAEWSAQLPRDWKLAVRSLRPLFIRNCCLVLFMRQFT